MMRTWFAALVILAGAIGCESAGGDPPPDPPGGPNGPGTPVRTAPGRYVVLAIDRSGSRTSEEVARDQRLLAHIVDTLTFGDTAVVMDVCEAGRNVDCEPWVAGMPGLPEGGRATARERRELEAARADVKYRVEELLGRPERPKATNLFGTLRYVDDLAAGVRGPVTLVVFSDMLQAAEGVYLARSIPDPASIKRVPRLDGVCVSAVGVDDPGTERGQRVEAFWSGYFARTQARFAPERYRYFIGSGHQVFCSAA